MTEYVVAHLVEKGVVTPTFNEAASKLQANKDVKVIDSISKADKGVFGAFLIETDDKTIEQVKKDLPGWAISPNQHIKLID
jgi:hypothetical protein